MENEKVLELLKKLEVFRKKLELGEIAEGCSDWIVRSCEAIVADGCFRNRSEWEDKINNFQ